MLLSRDSESRELSEFPRIVALVLLVLLCVPGQALFLQLVLLDGLMDGGFAIQCLATEQHAVC